MKLILGTMNIGPQVDQARSREMLHDFLANGYRELDTAYVYNNGVTEQILGGLLPAHPKEAYAVATKVHPRVTGRLDGAAVMMQFNESLQRMNQESVDILYFHFPERVTPIEDALETCAQLHQEGKFKELGLSNMPAWMVVDIWHICTKRGWPLPTVYQGLYNGLSRNVERELFDALRKTNIRFYAFNPLAGGMLTGKHKDFKAEPVDGRFTRLESYRNRYWKESFFNAVDQFVQSCIAAEITPVEASFRWLAHHSLLDADKGDGIILGASSIEQLQQNMKAVRKGVLPETVQEALDKAWLQAKPDSPEYFRFF